MIQMIGPHAIKRRLGKCRPGARKKVAERISPRTHPVRLSRGQHYGKWLGNRRGKDDQAGQTCYLLPHDFQQVGILVRSARRITDNDRLNPIR
jgi:hypothetical protein